MKISILPIFVDNIVEKGRCFPSLIIIFGMSYETCSNIIFQLRFGLNNYAVCCDCEESAVSTDNSLISYIFTFENMLTIHNFQTKLKRNLIIIKITLQM